MGWSEEVHARRTYELREQARERHAAGQYAVPEIKGNSSLLSIITLTGTLPYPVLSCLSTAVASGSMRADLSQTLQGQWPRGRPGKGRAAT